MAVAREWFVPTQIPSDLEEEEYQFGAPHGLLFLFLVNQSLPLLAALWAMLSQLLRAAAGALRA